MFLKSLLFCLLCVIKNDTYAAVAHSEPIPIKQKVLDCLDSTFDTGKSFRDRKSPELLDIYNCEGRLTRTSSMDALTTSPRPLSIDSDEENDSVPIIPHAESIFAFQIKDLVIAIPKPQARAVVATPKPKPVDMNQKITVEHVDSDIILQMKDDRTCELWRRILSMNTSQRK